MVGVRCDAVQSTTLTCPRCVLQLRPAASGTTKVVGRCRRSSAEWSRTRLSSSLFPACFTAGLSAYAAPSRRSTIIKVDWPTSVRQWQATAQFHAGVACVRCRCVRRAELLTAAAVSPHCSSRACETLPRHFFVSRLAKKVAGLHDACGQQEALCSAQRPGPRPRRHSSRNGSCCQRDIQARPR